MKRTYRLAWATLLLTSLSFASPPPSSTPLAAPPEVVAAAPAGTTVLAFVTGGDSSRADALAVFETAADKDNVRYRTLVMFGEVDGRFVPDFSNDKLIACSRCSQFHDDPFYRGGVTISSGHVHINQSDAGEKPSETDLDFIRKKGTWLVARASRRVVVAGDGAVTEEKLQRPASGLAKDLHVTWRVPIFLNTIIINHRKGNKFSFLHGDTSVDAMWKNEGDDCNKQDCTILVQQQDGCISLVRDASARPFGAGTPDPKDKQAAAAKAMDACSAAGGKACEEVRTDCSEGIY